MTFHDRRNHVNYPNRLVECKISQGIKLQLNIIDRMRRAAATRRKCTSNIISKLRHAAGTSTIACAEHNYVLDCIRAGAEV